MRGGVGDKLITARRLAAVSVAIGATVALAVPSAAMAAVPVSQATGRLVATSLLSSAVLTSVPVLSGATAIDTSTSSDVTVTTPMTAAGTSAVGALRLSVTNVPLFGNTGVIRFGGVGQYAQAKRDGSSVGFSGTISAAPALIGVTAGAVTSGTDLGTPITGTSAELQFGTTAVLGGTDLVNLDTTIGALAGAAKEDAAGAQSGKYNLAELTTTVGGTLVAAPTGTLHTALDALIAALNTAGVTTVINPFGTSGKISLSAVELQAAGLGSDLNNLPVDTDLLSFVPLAASTKIATLAKSVMDVANAAVSTVPVLQRPALQTAINTADAVVTPLLTALATSLRTPLATAIGAVGQLRVNHQATVSGAFVETALQVRLGASGAIASVDLASASVGPSASQAGPTTPPTTGAGSDPGAGAPAAGSGTSVTGSSSTGALAKTGVNVENLLPLGALAFALVAAGVVLAVLRARQRSRTRVGGN